MSDWPGIFLGTAIILTVLGMGVVLMTWWRIWRLTKLARRYPLRRMRDAKAGDKLRVRGRVVTGGAPRWRDPVDAEPVVLARLVVRNTAKVVVDITRGERFELEDDAGTRAVIHIDGAVLENTHEAVVLTLPLQEPLRNFATPRGLELIQQLLEWEKRGKRTRRTSRSLAELTKICPRDEIEVMGVARRDETSPEAIGYREARGTLTLGGKGEVPVWVLKPGLDGMLAKWRRMRRAGCVATALGAALLSVWLLWSQG